MDILATVRMELTVVSLLLQQHLRTASEGCGMRFLLRPWRVVAALLVALLFIGCTKSYDAWLVNPCDRELKVETFDVRVDRASREEPLTRVALPAVSVTKVEDAFTDAAGRNWTIVVNGTKALAVDGDSWRNKTVVIPAVYCSSRSR